jgi:general secretion pathway protein K
MGLLYVLWVVALLALLAGGFAGAAMTQAVSARTALAIARAQAAVDGALVLGVLEALGGDPRQVVAGERQKSLVGTPVRLRIEEAGGKVDLNRAPPELLRALLTAAGAAEADSLAEAVLARRAAMAALGRPGFAVVEELAALPGLDPGLYAVLAPAVTVLSRAEVVDPAVAPPLALLAASGRPREEAARFLAGRAAAGRLARLPGPYTGPLLGAGLELHAVALGTAAAGRAVQLRPVAPPAASGTAVLGWRRPEILSGPETWRPER